MHTNLKRKTFAFVFQFSISISNSFCNFLYVNCYTVQLLTVKRISYNTHTDTFSIMLLLLCTWNMLPEKKKKTLKANERKKKPS